VTIAQPTTQVGFRSVSRDSLGALTPESAERSEARADAVSQRADEVPSVPVFHSTAAARAPFRPHVAWPLALAILAIMFWDALTRPAPAHPIRVASTRALPRIERSVTASLLDATGVSSTPAPTASPDRAPDAAPVAPARAPAKTAPKHASPQAALAPRASAPVAQDNDLADTLRAKARTYFRHAEFEHAAQTYRLAIQFAPSYAGAYAGLGASQLALGDARGAIASYKQAIRRAPGSSGFHAALGRAYVMARERERAIAEYRKAVALDPSNAIASKALATLTTR
jgi:tetratricopeptide (TPR) repeat protein